MPNIKKWLIICLLLETLCVTYALRFSTLIPFATILYTISGFAIALLLLRMPRKQIDISFSFGKEQVAWTYQLMLLLFGGFVIYLFTRSWINQSSLSYVEADMLPIMQVMSQRFLQGDLLMVYQPIQEIWNGIQPIYLPAMWMPFLASVKFDFDPRWITSFAVYLSFSIFILLWRVHWQKIAGPILLLIAGVLCMWLYTEPTHNFIRLSEEGIVVFYYSLLVLAILSEHFLLIGIAAALCALSRYAIAGWLPAMLLYLFLVHKQHKDTIRFLVGGFGVVLLLVIIPFGFEPIRIAFHQPEQYIEHAKRIWRESPEYFHQSMGLAKFFGPERILLQHNLLLISSFLLPIVFVWLASRQKQRSNNYIALATLKLTIVVVYALIDVPYQYLFYTSSFISLIAVTGVMDVVTQKSDVTMEHH